MPKIVSEYDQEIPQSQTADKPVAPRGRAAQTSPSPRCSFCQEEETINHMLWQCQKSQNLLRDFKIWLNNNTINLRFLEELFIFNIGSIYSSADLPWGCLRFVIVVFSGHTHLLFLHIFYYCQYYIFAAKRLNLPLSIVALQNKVKHSYILMQHTATRKCYLDKFESTWSKCKDLINTIH